ncbi:AAA family ATPase [Vibrio parahaemolyticus]|uniref:AAA family ATPase n=3 Tax=Vibrio parahaemolyticus TaxID=670 RepID=UPI00042744C3|nr:AAA family ATPase [Vibrio parahaemolyticus]EIF8963176.1 AAA family ATPase [Vibrio parahaemolyticus]MDT8848642.1 AAA family ATPase [Vibrio parahaemolyticus]MDT8921008.1 AAA family ATPase [Vibrio parahaemolyticus]TOE02164.1 hypothetical protein CGJ52_24105 [Vibrio parahaemolyticus]TOE03508.1 hypothetical protein CGJ51_23865 [Vibrio parahaemolyticus]
MLQITFPKEPTSFVVSRDEEKFRIISDVDKYYYNVKKEPNFDLVLSQQKTKALKQFSNDRMPCFYCGSHYAKLIPAFLHDTSGYNLWLFYDWRSSILMCKRCHLNYGSSNIKYIRRVKEVKKGSFNSLLSFEPEILIPTLEPVHLHFSYDSRGYLIPKSERAERTISRLALNNEDLVRRRCYIIDRVSDSDYINDIYIDDRNWESRLNKLALGYDLDMKAEIHPIDLLFIQTNHKNILNLINNLSNYFVGHFQYYRSSFDNRIPLKNITYKNINYSKVRKMQFSGLNSLIFSGVRGFRKEQHVNFNGKSSLIIVGENGVGKSTFLELMKRGLKSHYKNHVNDLVENDFQFPVFYQVKYNNSGSEFLYVPNKRAKGARERCHVVSISDSRSSSKGAHHIVNFLSKINIEKDLTKWVCKTLADLLELPNGKKVIFREKFLYIYDIDTNKELSIECLSSGYNSIINIFGMILSEFDKVGAVNNVESIYDNMSSTVALIDEIELHLHPKFKKNIISNLKSTFPNVLFVFTTHDPMVLSSSDNDDIVLLFERDDSGQSHIRGDLPDHSELSTQQILSSPIFGLKSFSNANVDALINKYYSALRLGDRRGSKELRKELGKLGYFGQSYRELLAFSAVDAYLSKGLEPDFDNIVSFLERVDRND